MGFEWDLGASEKPQAWRNPLSEMAGCGPEWV